MDCTHIFRELLDSMIPPIPDGESANEGLCASLEPCTREEVKDQWKTLDFILQLRQARETGICPIREQIYSNAILIFFCQYSN